MTSTERLYALRNEENIKDWRSTGRRKGRRVLYASRRDYACDTCGRTVINPPKDAPDYFDEIWPTANRVLTKLEVQHKTKDLRDNDEAFLSWLCPSCHKLEDMETAVGESTLAPVKFF